MTAIIVGICYILAVVFLIRFFQRVHEWDTVIERTLNGVFPKKSRVGKNGAKRKRLLRVENMRRSMSHKGGPLLDSKSR